MVSGSMWTLEGPVNVVRCLICGEITDTVFEKNRKDPPKPPERRGRKPAILSSVGKVKKYNSKG